MHLFTGRVVSPIYRVLRSYFLLELKREKLGALYQGARSIDKILCRNSLVFIPDI
jgi:hypothetical protein